MLDIPSLTAAFQRVKENHGCAGVDGVTIERFEAELNRNISMLLHELESKLYFPMPLLQILVDKGNGEARKLCIPAVRDRIVQTAVLHEIEPILEKQFEECSFAYRKGRSVKQAVYKIKEYYEAGYRWVVDADIDAFFDSVDHELLIAKVKRFIKDADVLRLIDLWIRAEVWDGESVKVINKGIPQGSSVSPVLANLFLDELDEAMLNKGYRYIRYADDRVPRRRMVGRSSSVQLCCIRDEGRPLEAAMQVEASNHRKLRWLRAGVVSVTEKAEQDSVR